MLGFFFFFGYFFFKSGRCLHDRRHSIKPKQTIYLDCNVFLYHPERMEEGPKRKEKKVEQHQSAKNPEQMGIADSLLHEKLIDKFTWSCHIKTYMTSFILCN